MFSCHFDPRFVKFSTMALAGLIVINGGVRLNGSLDLGIGTTSFKDSDIPNVLKNLSLTEPLVYFLDYPGSLLLSPFLEKLDRFNGADNHGN